MKYKIIASEEKATIQIFDHIGEKGFSLADFKMAIQGIEAAHLEIEINSPGGDAFEAFGIHDVIKNMEARVTVYIIGVAASAATIIAAAADKVMITENSRYLVHEAISGVGGKKDELKNAAEILQKVDEQMLSIYIKRTGKTRAELEELMKKDTYLSAWEALEWGFVDEVINVKKDKSMKQKQLEIAAMAADEEEKKDEKPDTNEDTIKDLKAKLAKMEEELEEALKALAAYKEKEEEAKAKEAEEKVEANIKAGKIKAESKAEMLEMALEKPKLFDSVMNGITMPEHPAAKALKNANGNGEAVQKPRTAAEAFQQWKEGKIKTSFEYINALKELEG